jgi:hypothetical protein
VYSVSYFTVSGGISYLELQSLCPGLLFTSEAPACMQFAISYVSRLKMYRLIIPLFFLCYETSLRSCKKEVAAVTQLAHPYSTSVDLSPILYSKEEHREIYHH